MKNCYSFSEFSIIGSGQGAPQEQSAFVGDGLPFIRASSLEKLCTGGSLQEVERINFQSAKKHRMKLYPSGVVVFAKSGMSATKDRVYVLPKPSYVVSHLATIDVDRRAGFPKYIKYFWENFGPSRLIKDESYPSISLEDIGNIKICLPPLPEQQHIAAILEKADRLRRLRRYALVMGEMYLQAVFLEMFGDPIRNEKGWKRVSIADIGKIQTGNTPSRQESNNFGEFIEWIKSDNILNDQLYLSESREMLSEAGLSKGRSVNSGAVLMTCIAGSLSHIGDVAIANRRVSFNQQINAISPYVDVNPLYLYCMFKIAKPKIQQCASSGMKHIITKSKLEEIVLVKPPKQNQDRFAEVVVCNERLRAQQREALRQAEHLFQTLLHRAFNELL